MRSPWLSSACAEVFPLVFPIILVVAHFATNPACVTSAILPTPKFVFVCCFYIPLLYSFLFSEWPVFRAWYRNRSVLLFPAFYLLYSAMMIKQTNECAKPPIFYLTVDYCARLLTWQDLLMLCIDFGLSNWILFLGLLKIDYIYMVKKCGYIHPSNIILKKNLRIKKKKTKNSYSLRRYFGVVGSCFVLVFEVFVLVSEVRVFVCGCFLVVCCC